VGYSETAPQGELIAKFNISTLKILFKIKKEMASLKKNGQK